MCLCLGPNHNLQLWFAMLCFGKELITAQCGIFMHFVCVSERLVWVLRSNKLVQVQATFSGIRGIRWGNTFCRVLYFYFWNILDFNEVFLLQFNPIATLFHCLFFCPVTNEIIIVLLWKLADGKAKCSALEELKTHEDTVGCISPPMALD